MNKYQEAISFIEKQLTTGMYGNEQYFKKVHASVDSLKELVDKATPKKPLLRKDGYDDGSEICDTWDCPNCGETYVIEDDTDKCNYCPNCGQRIDWSKDETD